MKHLIVLAERSVQPDRAMPWRIRRLDAEKRGGDPERPRRAKVRRMDRVADWFVCRKTDA
jgi:hypothetical protein